MTVNSPRTPCGGTSVPPSAIHSGDWIRVDDEGHEITAHVIGAAHGPGHSPGGAGIDWEEAFPPEGPPGSFHHGHIEYTAEQPVIRVWAGPVPGVAA